MPHPRRDWRSDDGGTTVHHVIDMIGRADAAAAIARFMDRVPSGPVGLVIEGEPGIGKTTVVLEVVRRGRAATIQVLQARPAESEADLSFAVLSDLVGAGSTRCVTSCRRRSGKRSRSPCCSGTPTCRRTHARQPARSSPLWRCSADAVRW